MDNQTIYVNSTLPRDSAIEMSSPSSLHQNVCRGPCQQSFALKLGCAGIILLALTLIGLQISVISLIQNSSKEKSSVDSQENRKETTERPVPLKCPVDWQQIRDKCLYFHKASKPWNDSLADCSARESSLLLIQDKEELRLIQNLINNDGIMFWIGLNFTLSEKNWKWINGSFLNSNVLPVFGDAIEDGCVCLSRTQFISDYCAAQNRWICQKELKSFRNRAICSSN